MDALEKIKIYAQMLLEVINEAEKKKEQEKERAAAAKERQMLIDLSGISVSTKPRADGRYQGYYTHDGKKHYVYGKSEQEVKIKIELYLKNGLPKKKKAAEQKKAAPTVSEWLEKWIELYKAPNLKPSTLKNMRASIKVAEERLGEKRLAQVTAEELQELLLGIGGGRSRELMRGYLDQAFRKAVTSGYIPRNPCDALELKRHKAARRNALTVAQQELFIEEAKGLKMQALLLFLLSTGLRIGEALALTYGDIDFGRKSVRVSKNVVFIEGERIEQDAPKSEAGNRIVPIPEGVLSLLDAGADKEAEVFPFTYSAVRNCFRRISEKLGISVSPHVLRHTYATRLEEAGITPKLKQYLMGHSTLEMTQNTYTEVQAAYLEAQSGEIRGAFDTYLTPKSGY